MNKLWIFGDSFSVDSNVGNLYAVENQWHRLLGKKLNLEPSYHGHNGAALEWLYYTWFQASDHMSAGDVAVIAVTDFSRRWFFEEYPSIVSVRAAELSCFGDRLSNKQIKAIYNYTRFLHHNTVQPALLNNWLCSASDIAKRGVSVVILPAFADVEHELSRSSDRFPNLHIAKGYLFAQSVKEHKLGWQNHSLIKTEGRSCHFTVPNHHVIVDKILACLDKGEAIDLNTGFHECLINEHNLSSEELFVNTHVVVDTVFRKLL